MNGFKSPSSSPSSTPSYYCNRQISTKSSYIYRVCSILDIGCHSSLHSLVVMLRDQFLETFLIVLPGVRQWDMPRKNLPSAEQTLTPTR